MSQFVIGVIIAIVIIAIAIWATITIKQYRSPHQSLKVEPPIVEKHKELLNPPQPVKVNIPKEEVYRRIVGLVNDPRMIDSVVFTIKMWCNETMEAEAVIKFEKQRRESAGRVAELRRQEALQEQQERERKAKLQQLREKRDDGEILTTGERNFLRYGFDFD